MIDSSEFRKYAHQIVDWMADYLENIQKYPVKSKAEPKEIYKQLPESAPERSESIEDILKDFQSIILPGMTHWQNPNFFAYFPANSSYPSILAEMLTSTLGAQCMKWATSPAATELEEKVMDWLKQMIGLPGNFEGVIQDTASTATLVAILSAREKYSDYAINEHGFKSYENLRVYCSTETHSSIEKAIKMAGIGRQNLVKVEVDEQFRLDPEKLQKAIDIDIKNGKKPICVVVATGTTGSCAIDPLKEIAKICSQKKIWLHVDAAYAGSALILPEYRHMIEGIEYVDSFVFNTHKWLFTNFDCSAYFVKNKEILIRTFEILPEYLKTKSDGKVNDYCDWGIQLGRRFRALKLWFVIRSFGVTGLQEKIRAHISLAKDFEEKILEDEMFELLTARNLNVICFRYKPLNINSNDELNTINEQLLNKLNNTGKLFLSHTKLNGKFTLRFVTAQTNVQQTHIDNAWKIIKETSNNMFSAAF